MSVLLFGTCLAVGCERASSDLEREGAERVPPLVVTQSAVRRPVRDEVEAIGTTFANESVIVTAQITDKVTRINFDDGDRVEAGQVLVELGTEEEIALLAEAEANAEDARRQATRLQNLLEQGSVPTSQADEARSRQKAAEARYESILARLAYRQIKAPFDGVLGFREVSEGTLVTPGTKITSLDDLSVIKLDFSVPEVHLGVLEPGLRLNARSPAFPSRSFDAVVRTIGSRIDPVTRSATVRALIANDDFLLRPGMLLTVRLVTAQRDALMVPETALVQRGGEVLVYVVDDAGLAQAQRVEIGVRRDGWAEVTAGLTEGTAVITDGVIKVRPGAPVDARPALASQG